MGAVLVSKFEYLIHWEGCMGSMQCNVEFGYQLSICPEFKDWTSGHRYSPYLTGNTLHLRYRDQPVNAVWGNSRCLL
jgi:hypothetical protein